MISDVTIPKKYVFVQASAPVGATEGALWYDTDTSELYSYDGSNWTSIISDTSYLDKQQLEQNINILINGASATSTLNDYDEMFLDLFTDADGYSNTIDTAETTATFDTDIYKNTSYAEGDENTRANGITFDGTSSVANYRGFKITTKTNDLYLKKITKNGSCTSSTAHLLDASHNSIASASFVGNDATFTNTNLNANTTYYFAVRSGGDSFTTKYTTGLGVYPINATDFNWISGYDGTSGDDTGAGMDVASVVVAQKTASYEDLLIQTNAITITENPVAHQVFCHNTLAGTGTITYNISFDNGVTWVTEQELNSKNTSVHNGSEMILKLNLNGTGAGNTATIKDYAVMLYY
jgi:hypothetical protein